MHHLLIGLAEVREEPSDVLPVLRTRAEDIRGHAVEQWLDELLDARDVELVAIHGVGVSLRVPGDLTDVRVAILAEEQVVAVLHRRECRVHEQGHEPVPHEFELLNDLGPNQAEAIREGREAEPRMQLLGDRCATNEMTSFEDEGAQPSLREVGAIDEAVVTATDNDGVVLVGVRHVRPAFARG